MDVARVIVASEDLPKCADGSTPHRVPLFVYRDVGGWRKTRYYTEYPTTEAFVDLSRGWVPGFSAHAFRTLACWARADARPQVG